MPKVKTNSSAKKSFKVTGTGKIMHQKAFKRHILTKKSKKEKGICAWTVPLQNHMWILLKRLLRLK